MPPQFLYVPPSAAALVESLRGIGYSTATALADIVDNSISAGARNIWIDFQWGGSASSVTVLDDGKGMSPEQLSEAMRLGGQGPSDTRAASDLGRFGLGLKTASFSQCRSLTVATRRDGQTAVCRWDLDYVANVAKDWHLLVGPAPGSEKFIAPLDAMQSGTLVLWQKLDRISGGDDEPPVLSQNSFLETVERVEEHLAVVFQRFLETGRPPIQLFINGTSDHHRVRPWDPFLSEHPATMRRPIERIQTRAGLVEVQGFILPHKDHLTRDLFERAAGHDGWTAQQGFYVYRNRRLLVAGNWLGLGVGRLWTKEEAYKLARLRLDIPNTADEDWKIDVKKSTAHPPYNLRFRLRTLAEDVRQLARDVFAHRGDYGHRDHSPNLTRAWRTVERKDSVTYRIDRAHPAIKQVLDQAGFLSASVEAMLRVIEETVPVQRIWLDATEKGEVQGPDLEASPDLERVLQVIYRDLRKRVGLDAGRARARLLNTEPFQHFPDLVKELPDEPRE